MSDKELLLKLLSHLVEYGRSVSNGIEYVTQGLLVKRVFFPGPTNAFEVYTLTTVEVDGKESLRSHLKYRMIENLAPIYSEYEQSKLLNLEGVTHTAARKDLVPTSLARVGAKETDSLDEASIKALMEAVEFCFSEVGIDFESLVAEIKKLSTPEEIAEPQVEPEGSVE